ncbi:MAG TPA: hypothetical protein VJ883_00405 [Woeseiaceae bacterium]|nr:hypothetical protein [Woeseiaceae bacterium]
MKTQNPESGNGTESGTSCEAHFSAIDLVDQIQREAFRERFDRAPGPQWYPSLDTVRRAIAESD